MKCLILAGGKGDRMWPLSRKNNPKQFISLINNHSIFQDSIARNMAFCDEFIISSNVEYESIIENQMRVFRALTYRYIYEEIDRKTAFPIIMTAMSLAPSEVLFVVPSDQYIMGEEYKDDILKCKEMAQNGKMLTLDSGILFFKVGVFLNDVRSKLPKLYETAETVYKSRITQGSKTVFTSDVLQQYTPVSINEVFDKITDDFETVSAGYSWNRLKSLDDLDRLKIDCAGDNLVINNNSENTTVVNQCEDKLVLVNNVKDVMVVNTDDAIYIGAKGDADNLKGIIGNSKNMWGYFEKGRYNYRVWGEFRILDSDDTEGYEVRRMLILPGKTIELHKHTGIDEEWCIISGKGKAVVNEEILFLEQGMTVRINDGVMHQVSCISDKPLVFVNTRIGNALIKEKAIDDTTEDILVDETEPLVRLRPCFKDYIWGGSRLRDEYNKKCDYDCIAESWELSAHPDGQSVVDSGKYKGTLFGEYIKLIGEKSLGWKYSSGRAFPLLLKLIDAKENLSVQVHPDDDYALANENEYGKSEVWFIIDAQEDSYLYIGFKKDVTKEELLKSISDGTVLELLNKVKVKSGETYFIPAGCVHAIGAGCLICEIQQNSNTTYRLYDYDRCDRFGNKRELHISKALDVIDYKKYTNNKECKYFEWERITVHKKKTIDINEESFVALMVLKGSGNIAAGDVIIDISAGDCIFIPKNNMKVTLTGEMELIATRL